MSVFQPTLLAGGNISPCRICKMSGEWGVIQATDGNTEPCGISGPWTRYAPGTSFDTGYIAAAGQDCPVYTDGEGAMVEAGAAITGGNYIMSDANGRAITCTAGSYYVGQALESAAGSGNRIRVKLQRGFIHA